MPVLRCKDLKENVLSAGGQFDSITKSAFIEHIRTFSILVDKTVIIAEFLGAGRDVGITPYSTSNPMQDRDMAETTIDQVRDLCPPEVSRLSNISAKPDEMYRYGHRHVSISRPRGFGKTLILAMIDDFMRIGDSESSQRGRKLIFQQTEIWRRFPNFCERNFAQHPVIFASFKVREMWF